jgi:hypothetical protein
MKLNCFKIGIMKITKGSVITFVVGIVLGAAMGLNIDVEVHMLNSDEYARRELAEVIKEVGHLKAVQNSHAIQVNHYQKYHK